MQPRARPTDLATRMCHPTLRCYRNCRITNKATRSSCRTHVASILSQLFFTQYDRATQVTWLMAFCWLGTTKKSLNGHQTPFLVRSRGWGLGMRLRKWLPAILDYTKNAKLSICPECLYWAQVDNMREDWIEEVCHTFILFCLFGHWHLCIGTNDTHSGRYRLNLMYRRDCWPIRVKGMVLTLCIGWIRQWQV